MAATTFLTGRAPDAPPEVAPLAGQPRLSLSEALRLLQTPSSESGVLAYHRALEGAPPAPPTLLAELAALREGRATRFELLTEIALSGRARARGVHGPGLLLIRVVRKAFVASGAAARVKARRAMASQAEMTAQTRSLSPSTSAEVSRKLVVLEGALRRLENRVFAEARLSDGATALAELELRIAALEHELRARILEDVGRST